MEISFKNIPNSFKRLAAFLHPQRKNIYLIVPLSFASSCIFGIIAKLTEIKLVVITTSLFASFTFIIFFWAMWLSLVCLKFYPNATYYKDNIPVNSFENVCNPFRWVTLLLNIFMLLVALGATIILSLQIFVYIAVQLRDII